MTTFTLTRQHYGLSPGTVVEYVSVSTVDKDQLVFKMIPDDNMLYLVPRDKVEENKCRGLKM